MEILCLGCLVLISGWQLLFVLTIVWLDLNPGPCFLRLSEPINRYLELWISANGTSLKNQFFILGVFVVTDKLKTQLSVCLSISSSTCKMLTFAHLFGKYRDCEMFETALTIAPCVKLICLHLGLLSFYCWGLRVSCSKCPQITYRLT